MPGRCDTFYCRNIVLLLLLHQGAIDAVRVEANTGGGNVGTGGVLLRKIVGVCILYCAKF